jgi:hypothetical protein
MRTVVPLYRISGGGQAPAFQAFVGGLLGRTEWKDFRDLQI